MPEPKTLSWWLIGTHLKRMRLAAGKTPEDVAMQRIASPAKLWRIENGQQSIKLPDLWALCALYRAQETQINDLARLVEGRPSPGTWEDFRDVIPGWFGLYLEVEAAAGLVESWHTELIYGGLQTEDYARALISADHRLAADDTDRLVQLRMERQGAVLEEAKIVSILGEGALHTQIGSRAVMEQQLKHLLAQTDRPNVTIRVLPWHAGAHAAMQAPFTILTLGKSGPDIAYVEHLTGAEYLEDEAHLGEYRTAYAWLHNHSIELREALS